MLLSKISFAASALAAAALVAAQSPTVALPMPPPPAVSKATLVGHMPPATVLNLSLSLAPPNRAALQAYANGVSNIQSAQYHRFLSPAEVGEQFGPSTATVNSVVSYLKSKGMTVTLVADNHMAILFKGRADKIETAFATKINKYSYPSRPDKGPKSFFSNATVPKLPASFASKVTAIGGMQTANVPIPFTTRMTPAQTRALYGAAPLFSGSGRRGLGVNIGITNFDGYRLSNLPLYYSSFGLPAPAGGVGSNVTKVSINGFDGELAGAAAEGDLDIQMVLGCAPLCNLFIYDGDDILATITKIANDNIVDIDTESYGIRGDALIVALHDQHLAMTAQGITYLAASGDTGTTEFSSYPHGDPEVLAVGGSDATVDNGGNRITELGWDGSGSGWDPTTTFSFNHLPVYQIGTTVPTGIDKRLYPDVALHATDSQFVFGGVLSDVGGTSSSSPQFAGILGLILEDLTDRGGVDFAPNGRPRFGRINDFIYSLDGDPEAFFDLSGGDTGILPDGSEGVGQPGWDFVTGWGAPIASGLDEKLLLLSGVSQSDEAVAASVYSTSSPNITFGTNVAGGAGNLSTTDGVTYSIQTVKQTGVGQVAATAIDFALTGDPAKRRSVSYSVAVTGPKLTTEYVYVKNIPASASAGKDVYDLLKTLTGTGSLTTVSGQLNLAKYVDSDSQVHLLVRGLLPTRLGSVPFRLVVDQALITERLSR